MSSTLQKGDEAGRVLVQVQNDLTQLKKTLEWSGVQGGSESLRVQVMDDAIRRTEDSIKRRAEEYLKMVNKEILTLPIIDDLEQKTMKLVRWQPPIGTITDVHPQKHRTAGVLLREKHQEAFTMRLLYRPLHPKNKGLQRPAVQLPDVHQKSVGTKKVITGPKVGSLAVIPVSLQNNLYPTKPLCKEDVGPGTASILGKGVPASADDLCLVQMLIKPKAAGRSHREDNCLNKMGVCEKVGNPRKDVSLNKNATQSTRSCGVEHPVRWTTLTPPPSAASDNRLLPQGAVRLTPINPQSAPALASAPVSKHCFSIAEGHIDSHAPDFCAFKERYCLCWGPLLETLDQLVRLLREFAVPHARVDGERLVAVVQSGEPRQGREGSTERLLSALENREEVWELVRRPGQRYKGEGGRQAAAVRIQACWRRHRARAAYLLRRRRKWAAGTIAVSWLLHSQLGRVRKSLQATRLRHLENYRSRAEYLAANWNHISTSRRTIIHLPSLGYTQQQRRSLRGFDILQNTQMGRLCDVRDENVEVIYVCPVQLGEDLIHYYTQLLSLQGAVENREVTAPSASSAKHFTILTPEAHRHFQKHSMCLSTLLKYSPQTLRRIKSRIQGRQAYLIGGVPHMDDLAVADELGVPILGPEPSVAQLYSAKSGIRRIFSSAGVGVPPGCGDIYTLQQLHECLARLMTNHLEVQRWLFKINGELGERGTAYCDVCHLSVRPWALQECHRHGPQLWRMAWAQEPVMVKILDAVPALLASHATPFTTSCYPTWTCFLEHFLREGGTVEAHPPSNSVRVLTVDLLVEPGGEVRMLSCGEQLRGAGAPQEDFCFMPQTSVSSDTLHSICMSVGRACHQHRIPGHLSLDLVAFLEPRSMEQQVWAVDLNLGYSNQLSMTQMMLFMSGGKLDSTAGLLEVPPPVRGRKPTARQRTPKANTLASVASRFAVMSSRLRHTNLSMLRYSVFFQMCKAQGIGFDIKERQGSVFALHDSTERSSLGMVTISPNLKGALLTFARNLSVIHQEISAPNMQGETNFKDLLKRIEEVLGMMAKEDKEEKSAE